MQTDLQPGPNPEQPVHLVVVPHTHWDREWYQPFQELRARLVRLMERLLDILERDPAFRHFHLDGQTIVLEDYLEIRPDRRARLRRLIGDGRIAVGPWYVLPDEFLVSGESLIRNLQIGHRLASEFGSPTKIGYLPDEFGHAAQLPQILAGFGIDSAVVWRGVGAGVSETLFRWEGLDGSAVLSVYLPLSGYSNGRNLPETAEELRSHLGEIIAEQAPFRRIPSLLVLDGTDHQEPQAAVPAALEAAVRGLDGVTCEIAPLARFVARARRDPASCKRTAASCAARGERLSRPASPRARALEATRLRQQQPPRALRRAARHLGRLLGGERQLVPFPDWAWKLAVQNHPHDSITGCSVDQVHRDMESRFDQVQMVVGQVLAQALAALIPRLHTMSAAPHTALAVYNPNGEGPNVVTANLSLDGAAAYELVDGAGRTVPLQAKVSASEVLLDAEMPPADVRPHVLAMQSREFLGMFVNELRLEPRRGEVDASITPDRMERGRLDWQALRAEWLAHLDDPNLRTVAVRRSEPALPRKVRSSRRISPGTASPSSPCAAPRRLRRRRSRGTREKSRTSSSRCGRTRMDRCASQTNRPAWCCRAATGSSTKAIGATSITSTPWTDKRSSNRSNHPRSRSTPINPWSRP